MILVFVRVNNRARVLYVHDYIHVCSVVHGVVTFLRCSYTYTCLSSMSHMVSPSTGEETSEGYVDILRTGIGQGTRRDDPDLLTLSPK